EKEAPEVSLFPKRELDLLQPSLASDGGDVHNLQHQDPHDDKERPDQLLPVFLEEERDGLDIQSCIDDQGGEANVGNHPSQGIEGTYEERVSTVPNLL